MQDICTTLKMEVATRQQRAMLKTLLPFDLIRVFFRFRLRKGLVVSTSSGIVSGPREMFGLNFPVFFRQDECALDDLPEFTDISRPGMHLEGPRRSR